MNLVPLRTNELLYASLFTLTTVSMTVVSRHAPKMFYLGVCTFTLVNVVYLDITLLTTTEGAPLKRWISVSCLVVSAMFFSIFVHTFTVTPPLLKSKNLGELCYRAGVLMTSVGVLVPLIRSFYRKSFLDWKQVDDFIQQDRTKMCNEWRFFDSLYRVSALLFPSTPYSSIAPETMALVPDSQRELLWKQTLLNLEEVHAFVESLPDQDNKQDLRSELLVEFEKCARMLKCLSAESQIRLTQEIRRFEELYPNMTTSLHKAYLDYQGEQREALYLTLDTQMESFERALQSIQTPKEFNDFQMKFFDFLGKIRFYLPAEMPKLQAFRITKMIPFQTSLQQKTSKKRAAENPLDLDESPADFFLSHSPTLGYPRFAHLLNDDVEAELTKYGITTLREFIDKVLGGDPKLLIELRAENSHEYIIPDVVFDKLRAYLKNGFSLRQRVYQTLASYAPTSSPFEREALSRLTYRVMILFMTLAPLIQDPSQALIGMMAAAAYQLPLIHQLALDLGIVHHFIIAYGPWLTAAARRPLLPQIRLRDTPELTEYLKSDVFGKMSLIGMELLTTAGLLHASLQVNVRPKLRIGPVIQGFVLGQELFNFKRA